LAATGAWSTWTWATNCANGEPELQEFLHLEYADKATLYVPVSQLQLISRYTGVSADEAPLHKLGSGQWEKAKRKAAEQVRDSAAELLNIYARRAAREGHAFRYSPHDYETFANDFGFEETADQKAAIHAVIQDMISPRPMDRLVCGDVGFGKTEVALRAAFVAVTGGKQVALLAPTTLLAEQHYQTLVDRFAKWPVKVAEMSRFRSGKEITAALKGLADGTVDIVVGTHKLLSESTKFKNLGLLIIDEEHRFGVRHKEQMKALRAEVDVLTLTATPIPAHAGHGAGGPARPERDRHRAAAPPGHQDLCAHRRQWRDPRGGAARAQARRPGLLPAQRGGDHREPPRRNSKSCCPRRASPWPTARCPSASWSA
jgi:transcription-repair coupling factor (superfamily II helicase)